MRIVFAGPLLRRMKKLPKETEVKFRKQVKLLSQNLRHPSLHAKKYNEAQDVWQARVDGNYRFYFAIRDGVYVVLNILKHPK